MSIKEDALKELATRRLEEMYAPQRADLIEYIKEHFKNENPKGIKEFRVQDFHYIIADKLHQVIEKKINRLIINIPPGHGKTELITKCFPVWAMGNNPFLQVISTGYSTSLTQSFSQEAKDYYLSDTFKKIFPRSSKMKKTQDTKEYWINEDDGSYYATGTGGTITGRRGNIFLIDDPIKPDEADKSQVVRTGINNWYDNTVLSRLFDPIHDAVIIVMQRTHDDDLCGYLMGKMKQGGEKFEILSLPAIAEEDETHVTRYGTFTRKAGEALDPFRYPLEALAMIRKNNPIVFSTQYQQQPVNKETQEFHEERFKYHGEGTANKTPPGLRIFTAVDPAFKQGMENDQTCIITGGFMGDQMYILEITAGRISADVMLDKIEYHIKKRQPEKVGIEAFQAQSMIGTFLKNTLTKQGIFVNIEEIRQTGDKLSKIRKLIPLYRHGLIYHKPGSDELELELKRFPRGKHDDIIDAMQMLYDLYALQPNSTQREVKINMQYDSYGRPVFNDFSNDDRLSDV